MIPLYRLEEVKYNVDPLVELVASQRNKALLYRKAFVRRCHNLHKAELEVLNYNYVPHILCVYPLNTLVHRKQACIVKTKWLIFSKA